MRMKILLQVLFWLLKSLYLSNLRICLLFFFKRSDAPRDLHSFPTRRSSDLPPQISVGAAVHVRMRKRLTKQASKCVEDVDFIVLHIGPKMRRCTLTGSLGGFGVVRLTGIAGMRI